MKQSDGLMTRALLFNLPNMLLKHQIYLGYQGVSLQAQTSSGQVVNHFRTGTIHSEVEDGFFVPEHTHPACATGTTGQGRVFVVNMIGMEISIRHGSTKLGENWDYQEE